MLSLSEVLNVRDSSHPSRSDTQSRAHVRTAFLHRLAREQNCRWNAYFSSPYKNLSDDRDSSESSENE
jgi:hypothetical protein